MLYFYIYIIVCMAQQKKEKQSKFDRLLLKKNKDLLSGQLSLFKLTSEYFWKSWTGPFFAFIFPCICITLIGYLMSYAAVLGGAICLGSYVIAIYALPNSVYDFKKSSLLKRIGVTPLNPSWFIAIICLFYLIIMLISIIWCFLFSMMIFSPFWNKGPVARQEFESLPNWIDLRGIETQFMSLKDVLSSVEWGGYIFSFFLSVAVGTTMGMMIVSLSRTAMQLQSMSVLVIIISLLVGGQAIPMTIVRNITPIWYISYIICPFKASLNMSTEAWNGPVSQGVGEKFLWLNEYGIWRQLGETIHMQNFGNSTIWEFNKPYIQISTVLMPNVEPGEVTILGKTEKIIDFILPFAWIGIFLGITKWKFRWSSR